jgi:protein-tyrosine phosphatase
MRGKVAEGLDRVRDRRHHDLDMPARLIDLHCHVLPALDDGASDLADSVAMAREAERDGIGHICATPHIRADHDVPIAELADRVAEVNAELARRGTEVRVLTGGEVAQAIVDELSDDDLRAVSLGGGGRWVLLEPPSGPLDERTEAAVESLAARGFDTVIAHPERHLSEELVPRLAGLVRGGALTQVTSSFLTHERAGPRMLRLAAHGLVHLVASDSHSSRSGRPLRITDGLARLATVPALSPHLGWIAREAPAAIVGGDPVTPPYSPAP